jgi:hypothetical protein
MLQLDDGEGLLTQPRGLHQKHERQNSRPFRPSHSRDTSSYTLPRFFCPGLLLPRPFEPLSRARRELHPPTMSTFGVTRVAASVNKRPSSKSWSTPLLSTFESQDRLFVEDFSSEMTEANTSSHMDSVKRVLSPVETRRSISQEGRTWQDEHSNVCCLENGKMRSHLDDREMTAPLSASDRHRILAHAFLLTACESSLGLVLQGYDHCHIDATQEVCVSFVANLPRFLRFLAYTTPSVFVLAALVWSVLAMRQYHVCGDDRFQQVFLVIGLIVGFWASLDDGKVVSSRLAFAVTVAMLLSACGHWAYNMVCRSNVEELPTRGDRDGKE